MTDALERLIEAVEAGEFTLNGDPSIPAHLGQLIDDALGDKADLWADLVGADAGSMDDARTLHEVLLPGWTACVGQNAHHGDWNAFVRLAQDGAITREHWGGTDDNPARAWLLAILRAKLTDADNSTPHDETAV